MTALNGVPSRAPGKNGVVELAQVRPAQAAEQAVLVAEPVVDAAIALVGVLADRQWRCRSRSAGYLPGVIGWLAAGYSDMIFAAAGSNRLAGIMLPGNGVANQLSVHGRVVDADRRSAP